MNKDDRQSRVAAVKSETERLDIGVRVHVVVQRRLRHADFYLRSPVRDVRPRCWTRIDVKNVAGVIGELLDVFKILALVNRNSFNRNRKVREERGNDERDHAEHCILRDD